MTAYDENGENGQNDETGESDDGGTDRKSVV